jgi:protein-L-isoaspartate(D-aspartate) O-methyltransferase
MVDRQIRARGITDPALLQAFRSVPREEFVPPGTPLRAAYGDHPLPIGSGQTISQPFIVALMIDLLHVSEGDRVLEVGAGSGYQAALLSHMGVEVVGLELHADLALRAASSLRRAGLDGGVSLIVADGYRGWSPGEPYDGIVVAAAPPKMPPALPRQLGPGGRLVIPVGRVFQELVVVSRTEEGFETTPVEAVRFVPLVRRDG